MKNALVTALLVAACGAPPDDAPTTSRDAHVDQCDRPPLEPCPADGAAVVVFADAECAAPVVRIVDTCPPVESVTGAAGMYLAGDVIEPDDTGAVRLHMHTNCGCVAFVMPSNATYHAGFLAKEMREP